MGIMFRLPAELSAEQKMFVARTKFIVFFCTTSRLSGELMSIIAPPLFYLFRGGPSSYLKKRGFSAEICNAVSISPILPAHLIKGGLPDFRSYLF